MIRRTYQMDGEPQNNGGTPPQQPQTQDLGGYPTVEALVQGYRNSGVEAQRWRERALQLEQTMVANQPRPVQQSPYDRLNEFGLPTDALREAVNEQIQQAFQPIARGLSARNQVLGRYPDYNKFEADVANFINSDQERQQTYNAMFNADPVGAMEYAFLKFGEQQRRATPPPQNGGDEGTKVQAKIPSSRTGESRNKDQSEDLTGKAWEHFNKTGDPRAFAKARLRQVIPDSFFEGR